MNSANSILAPDQSSESHVMGRAMWVDRTPGGVLLAACLIGSLSSIAITQACVACGRAHALAGGLPLGWIGSCGYGGLLLAWLLGWRRVVRGGLAAAGGAHMALVSVLIASRIPCIPCWITGVLAITGAMTLLAQSRRWASLGIAMAAAAICMIFTLNVAAGRARQHAWDAAMSAGLALVREPTDQKVRLVIFVRNGCEHCRKLKEETLPAVLSSLANPPTVEERDASSEMTTPTMVLLGKRNFVMVESPSVEELKAAIQAADSLDIPLPAEARLLGR